ncbi:hypothetical protein EFY79_21145, partial [Hanamia caeni]
MKTLLYLLFIVFGFTANAKTFYVSNGGNDLNSGVDPTTPWQTLSKVNSFTFNPGDQISFKRGDAFYGRITINQSGTSGNPITFGAYGTGANPVFNGFVSVTSWTNLGSNIWESSGAVSTLPTLKIVVINNINTPMGASPNRDATYPFLPNYFTFQSYSGSGMGTTTITSTNLSSATNWTGADVVVRANHWTLDKETITNQAGSTITYQGQTNAISENATNGFWIQNDPRTLDVQNEWYYNPSTKKIRIYSTSQPQNVRVATVDTMIYAGGKSYITVDNIDFTGANTSALVFSGCNHSTITNSNISYTGETAIQAQNTSNYLYVENCNLSDFGGAGIWNTDNGTNWIIRNNTFKRCGLVSVVKPNDYTNGAIEIFSDNALIQYNIIDSVAYEGIHFRGNNVQVRNNFVDHFTFLRDDGGGIYTGFTNETGKIIDGNIVLNAIGNSRGIIAGDAAGNGIYLDGLTDDATVTNNTVAHIVSAGIFLNNGRLNKIHNNTVYDIGGDHWTRGALMVQTYGSAPYASYQRNNNVTNNIFFQKRASQVGIFYYTDNGSNNAIQDFGILDSNYYAKATDNSYFVTYRAEGGGYQNLGLSQFQTVTGKELNGNFYNQKIIDTSTTLFLYNPTKNDSTISLPANFKDVRGNTFSRSITLSPYCSAILIYDSPSTSNIPPIADVGSDRSIQLPKNSIVLPGNDSYDPDGTIISYRWLQISGPTQATITNVNLPDGGVLDLTEGTYQFQLTVTDDKGATGTKILNVTVNEAANIPPTANAGNDQTITLPKNSISLNGTAVDSDGSISSYSWTKVSGPASGTINNANSSSATVTNLSAGTYQYQLAVSDNKGAIAKSTVNVTVNEAANIPPTANAGNDQTITLPKNSISLNGTAVDSDGSISSYSWTKVSGPASGTINNANSSSATVTNLSAGTYQYQLAVSDNKGAIAKSTVNVTVNEAANIPPTANAGND